MIYEIKAPEEIEDVFKGCHKKYKKIFLAGGITNCHNWQREMVKNIARLTSEDLILINPRYEDYSYTENKERLQVIWEARHMDMADAIVYWFTPPTLNPITLFELGRFIESDKKLFIGIDEGYEKRNNVMAQIMYCHCIKQVSKSHDRFEVLSKVDNGTVSSTKEHLAGRIIAWLRKFNLN